MGLGLAVDPDAPLVACIGRLVPQKGVHLIKHSVVRVWWAYLARPVACQPILNSSRLQHRTAQLGGQFVLLGSGHLEGDFRAMAEGEFRDSDTVKCATGEVGAGWKSKSQPQQATTLPTHTGCC